MEFIFYMHVYLCCVTQQPGFFAGRNKSANCGTEMNTYFRSVLFGDFTQHKMFVSYRCTTQFICPIFKYQAEQQIQHIIIT
jgi:hypothetical protein